MTRPHNPPNRGTTPAQRMLPESNDVEGIRRALNRIYDQIDRVNTDVTTVRNTLSPTSSPLTPGGQAVSTTPSGGSSVSTGSGGSTTPTTTTTTPKVPVTFYVVASNAGVISIDAEGFARLEPITIVQ